ncbi:MAG: VOC family protein [Nitrospiria bacterium]
MMKLLHTRIRVGDLERSIVFYCRHFGFYLKKRTERSPSGNRVALLELPGNAHLLELAWSADYVLNVPEDLMHLAFGVPDLAAACQRLEHAGIKIWPKGWREKFNSGKKMAFVDDPDGYEIEILEYRLSESG